MTKVSRRVGAWMLVGAGMLLAGCGNSGQPSAGESEPKVGQLALPLVTHGASGTTYRLRDATFHISRYGYWGMAGSPSSGGVGGGGSDVVTVSSETDPDAATISVPLEEGYYYLQLAPGWHFEQQTPSGWENVEATLLSGETQYVYVSRQSTSFAEFQFGLGGREIWLNGQLNIGVVLYEDPPSGTGGAGGFAGGMGTAGSVTAGFPAMGGVGGSTF